MADSNEEHRADLTEVETVGMDLLVSGRPSARLDAERHSSRGRVRRGDRGEEEKDMFDNDCVMAAEVKYRRERIHENYGQVRRWTWPVPRDHVRR